METTLVPTKPAERIAILDILRGFAIFGVLVVNTFYFFNPFLVPPEVAISSIADRTTHFIINFLFVAKFYTLFSFLFGLGMFIQMKRAQDKGVRFVPLYLRRLLILAIFGFAHGVLLWIGDILLIYAVTGLALLLFFRNCKPRTLLIWAIILISLPLIFMTISVGSIELARTAPAETGIYEEIEASFTTATQQIEADIANDYDVYTNGNFVDITAERFSDFINLLLTIAWFSAPSVLAMFLLGVRAGKREWFTTPAEHRTTFRNLLLWALPLGLILNFYVAITGFSQNQLGLSADSFNWMMLTQLFALNIGSVLLCLSYIAIIVQLCNTANGARILKPLAPVGRMALSNYLTHSIVMTTLAYGYGFGLFGSVGLALGFLMSIVLYAIQIPLSNWWMRRFRFGPFEWIWRTLTYGTFQSIKIAEPPPTMK
ncbi:MAG: DUF418 domain-containing protein [Chloroflexi bacterium AL-W]|nr:DUF418 domain-containing protein [Chloroflexi bacterium AL-N1]NOK67101.1 DUF418 domain-containing protein [Chloroflexi bacterium AL-N10]NOK74606.1 DUF418 domain-containing protein [Chloroflexi bacterium AL-N5]NOK81703.1 DUF418 domain-containing protein [Chloroflexi bacterium AL-W]NOK89173.1 DUF418 domain-containing protein [Chloroflexi bacterium AL-N15]